MRYIVGIIVAFSLFGCSEKNQRPEEPEELTKEYVNTIISAVEENPDGLKEKAKDIADKYVDPNLDESEKERLVTSFGDYYTLLKEKAGPERKLVIKERFTADFRAEARLSYGKAPCTIKLTNVDGKWWINFHNTCSVGNVNYHY